MAKAKSSPKAQESKATKNQKPKGPVPNYTKKVKPVEAQPIKPAVKLSYYGISTALIAYIYDSKNMAAVSYVNDQLCWQAASGFAYDYKHDFVEVNDASLFGLRNKANKELLLTASNAQLVSGNFKLNAFEMESMGGIVTKGIFRKRQQFWKYVELAVHDRVPANLGFYFEDTLWSDVYRRAKAFDELVKEFAAAAKRFIENGFNPDWVGRVEEGESGIAELGFQIGGGVSCMIPDKEFHYQALKYWAIDNEPSSLVAENKPVEKQNTVVYQTKDLEVAAIAMSVMTDLSSYIETFEHVQPPLEGEIEMTLTQTFPK